jgi:hypothetical protein
LYFISLMKHLTRLKSLLFDNKSILFLYLAITLVAVLQLSVDRNNNFRIFRSSTLHLLQGLPLYIEYPKEYYDFFYYNPVFPILFMPFALMPLFPSLVLWLLATALCCYFVFKKLPLTDHKVKAFMLLLLFDLHNNLDHQQTNPFVLSFMLLVWILMEKEKLFWASMFIVLSFLIKGYGGIICLLCLYYKNWYKMIFYGLFWLLAFHSLMLLFMSPDMAIQYYKEWWTVISGNGIMESYSVYGVLKNLHEILPEGFILLSALTILGIFLTLQFFNKERNKSHIVAFLLIWVIVFNRASESATYIIAMAGCSIWYLSRPKNKISTVLFWTTILVSTLIPTDISKAFDQFRYQYFLKCVLSLLILSDIMIYTVVHTARNRKYLKPALI